MVAGQGRLPGQAGDICLVRWHSPTLYPGDALASSCRHSGTPAIILGERIGGGRSDDCWLKSLKVSCDL